MRELLMGNEAIAMGALVAGVQVVAGYPGTPSSEVLETIAKRNPGSVHVEWSVNEKAGAEVAVGAAYSGARAMVTMKQMGLNVSSDPVMCVGYIGVKGALVIYVADDPGPISSQTEQDTRHFGKYARIPVFDCDSPEQAFHAVQDAFAFSEEHQTPVILRSTTRVCHACADIDVPPIAPPAPASGFVKDSRWVIFPRLSYQNKQKLVRREQEISELFSNYRGNTIEGMSCPESASNPDGGTIGIACGGISYAYVKEAIAGCEDAFTVLKIGTPYPFPETLAIRFMEQVDRIIVFEELDPFIEDALIYIKGRRFAPARNAAERSRSSDRPEAVSCDGAPGADNGLPAAAPEILGKRTGTVPAAGELSPEIVAEILSRETGVLQAADAPIAESVPDFPVRPPVLCAGCPHRGAFYAVKTAAEKALRSAGRSGSIGDSPAGSPAAGPAKDAAPAAPAFTQAVYHGDIGCYTLGNAAPLNMVDTCLCMGAGITMAQGMNHADPLTLNFAFVGDSTFFASGITGTVNAVYNQAEMILCILDNSTTAMTGHQPHPGMGITMMGKRVEPIHIEKVLEGIGVPWVRIADPLDHAASADIVTEAIGQKGVRAIIFRSPCVAITKKTSVCEIDPARCVGCMRCIREIGCPALSPAKQAEVPDDAGSGAPSVPGSASDAPAVPTASAQATGRQKTVIDPALCNGCRLCAQICPIGCIEKHFPDKGAAAPAGGKEVK